MFKMAMLALANALAFTGSSCLLSRLSKDSIDAKRKSHDAAIEHPQKSPNRMGA